MCFNRFVINRYRLLKILGAKPEDEIVLKFWMTGLNKQYRSHLLTCSSAGSSSWPSLLTSSLNLDVLQSCSDKLVPSLQRLRILIDYDLLGHKNDWPLCALRELFWGCYWGYLATDKWCRIQTDKISFRYPHGTTGFSGSPWLYQTSSWWFSYSQEGSGENVRTSLCLEVFCLHKKMTSGRRKKSLL